VRLFDHAKVIEVVNRIHKEVVKAPEGVYFAFPFVGDQPTIRYEIQDAWVDPTQDQLPGANKEWFSTQHWISVGEPGLCIGLAPIEAPLFTINRIDRGRWPKTLSVRNGTLFSYIMDNYDGDDERPYQGGDFTFHYFISSERQFDPTDLYRFGRQAANPLVSFQVTSMDKKDAPPEPLDTSESGFIHIDNPAVVLSTWKAGEDRKSYIIRLYNTTAKGENMNLTFPHLRFKSVYHTNLLEANENVLQTEDGQVRVALKPHAVLSLRVIDLGLQ
jgi:hypothetical protein